MQFINARKTRISKMGTEFTSNTFENDYILSCLRHMLAELETEKPIDSILDHYAVELTAFMNGQIVQTVKNPVKAAQPEKRK